MQANWSQYRRCKMRRAKCVSALSVIRSYSDADTNLQFSLQDLLNSPRKIQTDTSESVFSMTEIDVDFPEGSPSPIPPPPPHTMSMTPQPVSSRSHKLTPLPPQRSSQMSMTPQPQSSTLLPLKTPHHRSHRSRSAERDPVTEMIESRETVLKLEAALDDVVEELNFSFAEYAQTEVCM